MLRNLKAQMAVVLAVGLLAGYAASGKLKLFQKADARPASQSSLSPVPHSHSGESGDGASQPAPACCCADGVSKAGLLATHNSAVKQKAAESGKKPNILVIWGDDIGYWNVSAYNRGVMGYRTPNIDRIAREGAIFTDCYGQQSCTAGRAAFITGQSPFRTGLLKVGLPGAREGLSAKDPTLADLLTPLGYVCGQFGKNHLGDRNDMLPTVHGFQEFSGNLYHLNAEEEPESPDYPKNPEFGEGDAWGSGYARDGMVRCHDPTAMLEFLHGPLPAVRSLHKTRQSCTPSPKQSQPPDSVVPNPSKEIQHAEEHQSPGRGLHRPRNAARLRGSTGQSQPGLLGLGPPAGPGVADRAERTDSGGA